MKERMPIWVQALALMLLCGVYFFTIAWALREEELGADKFYSVNQDILHWYMPIPILVLGIRFIWHVFGLDREKRWEALLCSFAMLLLLPVLISMVVPLVPARQRVREATFANLMTGIEDGRR